MGFITPHNICLSFVLRRTTAFATRQLLCTECGSTKATHPTKAAAVLRNMLMFARPSLLRRLLVPGSISHWIFATAVSLTPQTFVEMPRINAQLFFVISSTVTSQSPAPSLSNTVSNFNFSRFAKPLYVTHFSKRDNHPHCSPQSVHKTVEVPANSRNLLSPT